VLAPHLCGLEVFQGPGKRQALKTGLHLCESVLRVGQGRGWEGSNGRFVNLRTARPQQGNA
jgi:hypothetical protein